MTRSSLIGTLPVIAKHAPISIYSIYVAVSAASKAHTANVVGLRRPRAVWYALCVWTAAHVSLVQGFHQLHARHGFLKRSFAVKTLSLHQYVPTPRRLPSTSITSMHASTNLDALDEDDDGVPMSLPPVDVLPGVEPADVYSEQDLQQLTVPQLKQQLRLRGEKVSGRKSDLVNRLWNLNRQFTLSDDGDDADFELSATDNSSPEDVGTAIAGNDYMDVTPFLDPSDVGKATKSLSSPSRSNDDDTDEGNGSEVWGADARILDDTGAPDDSAQRVVVDSLSRTLLEFKGSNQSYVPAVVVATREALRPYLGGGSAARRNRTSTLTDATEQRLRDLQLQRERDAAVPVRFDDTEGLDEGDETGRFVDVLHREVSDWGKYTVTGAQLSAQEVAGVLLLSDVYGAFTPDMTALAEKIAFECQPVIVMTPDLFRGHPWVGPLDGTNEKGQSYDAWRATHDDVRVRIDIRAAAACLRDTYGVSSIAVWGTCYGGGRALEAAATQSNEDFILDVDGKTIGPPPVDPMVAVAWYPTRYNAGALFGQRNEPSPTNSKAHHVAVMGVFAGNDNTPGATAEDAAVLKQLLEADDYVVDHMIKVFPGQDHGFAHVGLSQPKLSDETERFFDEEFGGAGRLSMADGEAEVACLLSTAFMETYSRVFLPTVGPPISLDESANEWGRELTIKDLKETRNRDVRVELKEAIDNFVEEPLMSGPRIDPTDESQEAMLANLLRSMQDPSTTGPFKLDDDDDLPTLYKKLLSSDENFQIF